MPDNTAIPFTGLIDSERIGGWTAGGNFAPGLAITTNFSYNVVQIGNSWYFTRVVNNGQDLNIQTVGPYPSQALAILQMNNAKAMDGTH